MFKIPSVKSEMKFNTRVNEFRTLAIKNVLQDNNRRKLLKIQ